MVKKNKRITQAFIIYWLMLLYTIAALVWWYISLERQNQERFELELKTQQPHSTLSASEHSTTYTNLLIQKKRRTAKHLSEGITFLIVISVGAAFIYRLVHKQLKINKQQQNFVMAVTHELKTPIAIAKLNVETIQKHKLTEAQQHKLLQNTITEMHRLNDLATNILTVSQIETGDYRMNKEPIELNSLIADLVKDAKGLYPHQHIIFTATNTINITGDVLLIKLSFSNLIDNALKYSPKNSTITVAIEAQSILIKDEGVGISKDEASKIFEKFYRSGNEITRTQKGTGLGLYLCKKILNDHKATITVSNNHPKGSIFAVIFTI